MDNISLKSALEVYKQDTIKLIESLEKEEFDALDGLINKRQQIIEKIGNIDYSVEDFSKIVEELKILDLQQKLTSLMLEKRNKLKDELNKMSNSKSAVNMYNKRIYNNFRIVNKTI